MRSVPWLGKVLLVAIVIESASWIFVGPIDVGYPAGTPWYVQMGGVYWGVLHMITGLYFNRIEILSGCRSNIAGSCGRVDIIMLYLSGYLTSTVLCLAAALIVRRVQGRPRARHPNS